MYEFTEQCTIWLQMESVIKCAKSLGYEFNGRAFYIYKNVHTTGNKEAKQFFLGFNNMQAIHNSGGGNMVGGLLNMKRTWRFPRDKCEKIICKSYLQYNKKLKCFQTTKNMIKFT